MEKYEDEEQNGRDEFSDNEPDHLQRLIERHKLQNQILSEILEKLKPPEQGERDHETKN